MGLVIYAFLILILGALPEGGFYSTLQQVYEYFDSASKDIKSFISKYVPSGMNADDFDPAAIASQWIESHFSLEKLVSSISSFIGGIVNFFVGLVASIYLIKDKEFFLSLWQKFLSLILKQNIHGQVNETLSEINRVVTTFIKGALVDSMIVALLSSVALSALNIKFSVIIGLIGGILNIIPYFGPFFGMVPAFLVAFFSKGLASGVLAVLVLFLIRNWTAISYTQNRWGFSGAASIVCPYFPHCIRSFRRNIRHAAGGTCSRHYSSAGKEMGLQVLEL